MKKTKPVFMAMLALLWVSAVSAQSKLKETKAGHIFYVSLPDYMSKTKGLNNSATIEYKNEEKDVYGFVLEDNKEELKLVEMSFPSLKAFYDDFMKDFSEGEDQMKISEPVFKTKGAASFVECDVIMHEKEDNVDIYYLVGIAETKDAYYKVLAWCTPEDKDKYKADFEGILYSIRD